MQTRRQALTGLASLASAVFTAACGPVVPASAQQGKTEQPYTPEENAQMHKFRGVTGCELYISGFGKTAEEGFRAEVHDEHGGYVVAGPFFEKRDTKWGRSFGPTGPFKHLHVKLFDPKTTNYLRQDESGMHLASGKLYGEWIVPVAERIPDDLLDDLRRDPKGTLRIKLRFHWEGVLVGWDIDRRPGFDPNMRDAFGNPIFVSAVHSFAGGDFREAEIIEGEVVRKGWYIHPKTKKRIEIDF